MIIHSPIISGSLTFADGSTFTLPDGGNYSGSFSGSIQISEVQSHLIPNTNEEYDLGSSTNRFRDLYLSNNTIAFPSGSFGFGNNGFGFSDPFGDPAPIVAAEVKVIDSADGSFAKLSVVGGELTTKAFDPFGNESAFDMKSQLSGSFTGSFLGEMLATNGVVSGSSQITIGSVDGFTAYSASVDGRILTEKGRVDAILATADADKDSFAEIVTLINSVDTTNDNAFASFYTSSTDRLDNIEGFTSSIDATIKTKMDADSVVSGSSQLVSLLPSGVVSSSAQVNADSITNFDSNVKTKLDSDGVISSSIQVDVLQTTNFTEFSSSVADTFGGLSTDYTDLQNIPSGIISSSEQLAADFLDTLGDNVVSSSAQVDLTQTTNYASGIKLKLDSENVFSSSAQVTIGDTNGFSEFSSSVSDTFDGLSSNYEDLVGIPSGIVSGSSQVDVTATTNYSTVSSHISSTSNPHSVTATQVGLGNVDNTSDVNKPISTATQTALDLKADDADLTSHSGRTDNPHSVTKSQVGLGNVDNTSDADKPISTATQNALDLKATVSDLNTEKGRIDAILDSSDADKDSFAEIVGLINSVDTTNDTAFAGFVTSSNAAQAVQDGRLTALETESGSIASEQSIQDGRLDALEADSSLSTHINDTSNPHSVTATQVGLGNVTNESKATMFTSPTFTGTVSGVSKAMVGLGNVDNTSDSAKPVSTATQTALNLKATVVDLAVQTDRIDDLETFSSSLDGGFVTEAELAAATGALETTISNHTSDTDNPHSVTATQVGLGNVTNESKATMFTSPTLTGTTTIGSISFGDASIATSDGTIGITATSGISLLTSGGGDGVTIAANGNTTIYGALALESIPAATSGTSALVVGGSNVVSQRTLGSNAFTSTAYATAASVSNVDNTSDADKPVSTAQQTALNLKANLASPTFTGTVSGITNAMVGLGNVDNTSDADKPVSTAQQTALNLKANLASPTFTGTVSGVSKAMVGLGNVDDTSDADKPISTATQTALDLKLDASHDLDITLTGDVTGTATITNMGDVTIETTVGDDSHNHTIANVDGLQDALNLKANLASPTFTGTVTAPTPGDNDDSTKVATTAFVMREVNDLLGGAPAAFDTLLEISASIANGDSDVVALTTVVGGKLQKDQNLSDLTDAADARTNLGLENVTNESKATMFASPTFTGTVSGVTKTHVGLSNVTNESKTTMFASPTFTGTVSGVTKTHVGLGSVENTALSTYTGNGGSLDNQYITNGAGYTTYTSNQATSTTSNVTFASVSATGDVIAYASSDRRLKDNIVNIENPIEKVQKLNGVTWDWNDNADELQKSIANVGVIAQEVEEVLPQLVKDRENGYKGVDYAKLTGLLIEAVKEQQKQIDELKSRLG